MTNIIAVVVVWTYGLVCLVRPHRWIVSPFDSRWHECARCQKPGARISRVTGGGP